LIPDSGPTLNLPSASVLVTACLEPGGLFADPSDGANAATNSISAFATGIPSFNSTPETSGATTRGTGNMTHAEVAAPSTIAATVLESAIFFLTKCLVDTAQTSIARPVKFRFPFSGEATITEGYVPEFTQFQIEP
jgi:hypothetical protein